jgi:hypothetical protein
VVEAAAGAPGEEPAPLGFAKAERRGSRGCSL